MEVDSNRRRLKRFAASPDAFAALGEGFYRVGKIRDISSGGLSFDYISQGQEYPAPYRVDIFLTSGRYHLAKLPCRLVYARLAHIPEIGPVIPSFITHRCGLQFGSLSNDQTDGLHRFVDHRSLAPAP